MKSIGGTAEAARCSLTAEFEDLKACFADMMGFTQKNHGVIISYKTKEDRKNYAKFLVLIHQ